MSRLYEFRVDGWLTEQAREAFCDMHIEETAAGATLSGEVIDESHLLGVVAQCRTLGLVVVSARRVPRGVCGHGVAPRAAATPHPTSP
jgi:hypothetical protein